ncbi:hypothetical protein NC797_16235 [Aquibacillus sp. 3ASR75-11]|uniref:Uncharacterized protein n=1 Tax=Terrihalobacillus insolitus TaxID=2950438 RepID=A0A9X3WUR1_9BACI|nr:hypothetical protein [Terrihalobacillus insolitus]MDC3414491.1 hypothetical protein [Terrihalobacillus insolitus]MDC3426050.1 hypothetical protein [Terrihalobacillus insolitus]
MKKFKNKRGGIVRGILAEIRDSILFEILVRILLFLPRMVIRLIKEIY